MNEDNQTLHSIAWQRWRARTRSRYYDAAFPTHSVASKSSKIEWKKEYVALGPRKHLVWIRYKAGKLSINDLMYEEGRSCLQRQPHAAPSDSPTDAEIFSSFEARNIIAAAAAKRAAAAAAAATAAAAAPPALAKVAAALKAKPTAGPALNANRKRDAVRVSNFNQTSIKMKQNNTKQKQQRTPQRRSFRLATLQPKCVVQSSEEEFTNSSDSD